MGVKIAIRIREFYFLFMSTYGGRMEIFMNKKFLTNYFSLGEKLLWLFSILLIAISYIVFDSSNYLALIASLIGVTALIFCAKANPFGQLLMIIFGMVYGYISFTFKYYGEMITYVGMTVPMAFVSLFSWLKNSYNGSKSETLIRNIKKKDILKLVILTAVVTVVFYFILSLFNTANLIPSTISVATSFFAASLTFLRSEYSALAYAANDIILIILWILASIVDISYLSVIICFIVFLINDLYGFFNWQRIKKKQAGTN